MVANDVINRTITALRRLHDDLINNNLKDADDAVDDVILLWNVDNSLMERLMSTIDDVLGTIKYLRDNPREFEDDPEAVTSYIGDEVSTINRLYRRIVGDGTCVNEVNEESIRSSIRGSGGLLSDLANCAVNLSNAIQQYYVQDGVCIYDKRASPELINACRDVNKALSKLRNINSDDVSVHVYRDYVSFTDSRSTMNIDYEENEIVAYMHDEREAKTLAKLMRARCEYDSEDEKLMCKAGGVNPRDALLSALVIDNEASEDQGLINLMRDVAKDIEYENLERLLSY